MTAYNFKAQFADDVESGKKRQTIRALRKDMRIPRPGEKLQLYTGMRTKSCRLLREEICLSVSDIRITEYSINIDRHWLYPYEADALAEADGFDSWVELMQFFRDTHGLPFTGILIKW